MLQMPVRLQVRDCLPRMPARQMPDLQDVQAGAGAVREEESFGAAMTVKIIPGIIDTYGVYETDPRAPLGAVRVAVVIQQEPLVGVLKGTLTTAQQIEATKLIRAQQDTRRKVLRGGM